MAYVDLLTIHNPAPNNSPPASWGDQVRDNFEALKADVDALLAPGGIVPTGVILGFGGASAPSGYLLCQGQAVSRTTYSALLGVFGTTYGAGDGSTTFTLPDLRGRVGIGSGTGSGLTARTRGATGGEENHVLTVAELAYHQHTMDHIHNSPSGATTIETSPHKHQYVGVAFTPGSGQVAGGTDFTVGVVETGEELANHTHGMAGYYGNVGGIGSDSGHNTMQPFVVINYIVKV